MVNWTEIDEDFEYYQQSWEDTGLTYQDAREWVQTGFAPYAYSSVRIWKNFNFTPQEAKSWWDIGLIEWNDVEFAAYLRWKGYRPHQAKLKLERLREKFRNPPAQEYLDCFYPKSQRNTIKKLDISCKNLTSSLDLSDFFSLEELDCRGNQLTFLKLDKCLKLKEIRCLNNNFQQDLSFLSNLVNLEYLWISNNPFYGSLEPLKNLSKLKTLDIRNTDIDSGLEYLPESVETFYCLSDKRPEAKVKVLEKELRKGRGRPDAMNNFARLLPAWKKSNPDKVKVAQQEIRIVQQDQQIEKLNNQLKNKQNQITSLEEELQLEREEAREAMQAAQRWRERQLKEITAQRDREIEELKTENARLQQSVNQQAQILQTCPSK